MLYQTIEINPNVVSVIVFFDTLCVFFSNNINNTHVSCFPFVAIK